MIAIRLALALLLLAPAYAQQLEAPLLEAPKALKRTVPLMPRWAMDYNQPGEAVVTVNIDDSGKPYDASILYEMPNGKKFGSAALTSVKDWLFEPGKPGRYKVTVKFHIRDVTRVNVAEGKTAEEIAPIAPAPLKREPPVYPLLAQQKPLEGKVQIFVAIEKGRVVNGNVVDAGEVSNVFGDAAYYAVRKWRFAETLNGPYLIEIPFTLEGLRRGDFSDRERIRD